MIKHLLAVEKSNYLTEIAMFCILYDLDVWPRNPSNNFKFKDYLFGASVIVKNSDKQKYGIILDSAGSWNFNNDNARNVIISGVDNTWSSHANNLKNNFLALGEGSTFGINRNFGSL